MNIPAKKISVRPSNLLNPMTRIREMYLKVGQIIWMLIVLLAIVAMVARQETFLNYRSSALAKTIITTEIRWCLWLDSTQPSLIIKKKNFYINFLKYTKKLLSLQYEEILVEKVHKYPYLYDKDQASFHTLSDQIYHAVFFW